MATGYQHGRWGHVAAPDKRFDERGTKGSGGEYRADDFRLSNPIHYEEKYEEKMSMLFCP